MTRLSRITGLDRIGLPVWQAVRPLGRALSVHQGKGRTDAHARASALGEAIESHAAECLAPDRSRPGSDPLCSAAVDPFGLRAEEGDRPDAARIERWSRMRRIDDGRTVFAPHDCVALDFTREREQPVERSSTGLGAGATLEAALAKALFECIERDAVGTWLRQPALFREASEIDRATLPPGWCSPWEGRLDGAGIALRVFAVPSLTGAPCFFCALLPRQGASPAAVPAFGSACGDDPEEALFGAFAEAAQARLTMIAGSRDDLLADDYARLRGGRSVRAPPPWLLRRRPRAWASLAFDTGGWARHAAMLAAAGHSPLMRRLTRAGSPIQVVRVVVPGLGTLSRRRRGAA